MQLSAAPLLYRGDGDDQHPLGLDGALEPWMQEFFGSLDRIGLEKSVSYDMDEGTQLPPKYILTPISEPVVHERPSLASHVVTEMRRLTATAHFQDVRHVSLKSVTPQKGSRPLVPGDVAVIRPRNRKDTIEALIKRMAWQDVAETYFSIHCKRSDASKRLDGKQMTLYEIFERELDIFSPPRRSFCEWLANFTSNDLHRERLLYFASAEGYDEWLDYCVRMKRTVHEFLEDFDSVMIPYEYVFDVFPALRPRSFSLSACEPDGSVIDLTVGIVNYKTKMKASREGLLTRWLKEWAVGMEVDVSFCTGTLQFPRAGVATSILVAAGTGIAPIRSFFHRHR